MNRTDMKQKKKDPKPHTVPPPAKDSPWSMNSAEFIEMMRTATLVSIEPNTPEARARINAEARARIKPTAND